MVYDNSQFSHDEINLLRLLRRLEKSVASIEKWTPSKSIVAEDIILTAQKTSQYVKFSRELVKTIEIECEDTPKRSKRLNDAKIQLDRIDSFLKGVQLSLPQKPVRQNSLLAKLPLPKPPPQLEELSSSPGTNIEDDTLLSPPLDSGSTVKLAPSLKPSVSTKGLFIVPPDPAEVSPSLISTALPSLLPINPSETARTSAFKRTFGPTPTSRRDGAVGNQATTALHEELSSQLELMAQQLKRNAIHFSSSLANDKAVIEEASEKIEGNFNVMQGQRIKLRDRTSQSRSNTCLIMGIILLVFLLFMLMIMIIRLL